MNKDIPNAAVLITILVGLGCSAFMNFTQSSFFRDFSLRQLVEKNGSRAGLICSQGGIGGGGGGGRSSGGGKEFHLHKSESFTCRIKTAEGEQFNETEFITSLREDIEKEIEASGAKIVDRGAVDTGSFYFQYLIGEIQGRANISGKRVRDDYYSVKAELDERNREETK